MTSLYGHKWTTSFGDEIDPGNVWAAALRGLDMRMIKAGLNALVAARLEWPPSAIEFLKLCEHGTDDSGLPGIGSAVAMFLQQLAKESSRRSWSDIHPAIFWCYQQIGSFDCANQSQDKLIARFKEFWPMAVELAKAGRLQVPADARIEHADHSGTCTPGIAEQQIKKLKELF